MIGVVDKMRNSLRQALAGAAAAAVEAGQLPPVELPEYVVEVPRERDHGDFASNLAMLLPKQARMSPRKIAEILLENLPRSVQWLERTEVAGPGFINFHLDPRWVLEALPEAVARQSAYGRVEAGKGRKVQVEFVSANPTGLLHMGNARGAALGDSIASILDTAGWQVTREYYINDAGNQIENFALTLEARFFQLLGREAEVPESGYHGQDIIDTVRRFIEEHGDGLLDADCAKRLDTLVEYALKEKISAIKKGLADFGVHYDVWFSEQSLHSSGKVEEAVNRLRERGHIYEKDGALWFKASAFGVEKDEVLVRKNGIPTYFAADIAYHMNKFERGFDWVINIWGADHHGHVPRMKGAMEALGYNPEALHVILMQLVRLFSGGEIVRMSKRTGQFVTLEELVDEVGLDAARYFFIMRSADSHLDFDLDLARSQSNDNPVYYVQYAHARICSIFRQLAEQGRSIPPADGVDLKLLQEEAELALARRLADYPEEVAMAARQLAPHRIARYVHEMAGLLHSFYNVHRVITDDVDLSNARLLLVEATRVVLKNGLGLLGVSAPEKM
ncbi:arginyl-tRNA synthetase [Desulfotomaculum arcticum]|uniref:Arginine--tRNA ligase n=1 Tax=Desulfotruncus arcticus DSM 17038 TaxID=1121424 RepID=A0A1I2VK93_9FIRM|nr:arginine--tRNA ligase [Desulfotruncus arcticus]SFG87631.1 arginyl-tRNA synthetase [Desulfotomaculum arcticum] [Desulfotruncus arcticus DSM 17038]